MVSNPLTNYRLILLLVFSLDALAVSTATVAPPGGASPAPALAFPTTPVTVAAPLALYAPYSCRDGPSQEISQLLARKVAATLSILGSGYIVKIVWEKWRTNRASIDPYQRIMAAYSVYDILFSFFYWFLGSWMTPTVTGWLGAAGNGATCSIQGFFWIFGGVGSGLYQIMLSLQVLLLVTYKWRPSQFERRLEYRLHVFIWVFTAVVAAVPLFFQGYNPTCGSCAPVPLPVGCSDPWLRGNGTTECLRGSATITNICDAIFILLVTVATVFCTGAMITIYRSVYKQEKSMGRFSFRSEVHHTMSKSIRTRFFLYTSSFYVSWLLPLVFSAVPNSPPVLQMAGHALTPLMGFLNMLAFIMPTCQQYQKNHVGTWLATAYFLVMFETPIATIRRWIPSRDSAEQGADGPDIAEDGIGSGARNRQAETPEEGVVASVLGADAPTADEARGARDTFT